MNSPTSGKALPEFTLHYPSVWKTARSISPMLMELLVSFMRDSIFLIWSHTVSVLLPINSTADSIPVLYQLGHLPDRHTNKCCKYPQLMQRAAPVPLLLLVWKDVRTFSESILTLKSKSVSVKFLCRAEDRYWTVVTMILQAKTKRRKQKKNIWIWNTTYYSGWWSWFYYRYRDEPSLGNHCDIYTAVTVLCFNEQFVLINTWLWTFIIIVTSRIYTGAFKILSILHGWAIWLQGKWTNALLFLPF